MDPEEPSIPIDLQDLRWLALQGWSNPAREKFTTESGQEWPRESVVAALRFLPNYQPPRAGESVLEPTDGRWWESVLSYVRNLLEQNVSQIDPYKMAHFEEEWAKEIAKLQERGFSRSKALQIIQKLSETSGAASNQVQKEVEFIQREIKNIQESLSPGTEPLSSPLSKDRITQELARLRAHALQSGLTWDQTLEKEFSLFFQSLISSSPVSPSPEPVPTETSPDNPSPIPGSISEVPSSAAPTTELPKTSLSHEELVSILTQRAEERGMNLADVLKNPGLLLSEAVSTVKENLSSPVLSPEESQLAEEMVTAGADLAVAQSVVKSLIFSPTPPAYVAPVNSAPAALPSPSQTSDIKKPVVSHQEIITYLTQRAESQGLGLTDILRNPSSLLSVGLSAVVENISPPKLSTEQDQAISEMTAAGADPKLAQLAVESVSLEIALTSLKNQLTSEFSAQGNLSSEEIKLEVEKIIQQTTVSHYSPEDGQKIQELIDQKHITLADSIILAANESEAEISPSPRLSEQTSYTPPSRQTIEPQHGSPFSPLRSELQKQVWNNIYTRAGLPTPPSLRRAPSTAVGRIWGLFRNQFTGGIPAHVPAAGAASTGAKALAETAVAVGAKSVVSAGVSVGVKTAASGAAKLLAGPAGWILIAKDLLGFAKNGITGLFKKFFGKAAIEAKKKQGSILGWVGAGVGLLLGSILGPVGAAAGAFIGKITGDIVGKTIGGFIGLFKTITLGQQQPAKRFQDEGLGGYAKMVIIGLIIYFFFNQFILMPTIRNSAFAQPPTPLDEAPASQFTVTKTIKSPTPAEFSNTTDPLTITYGVKVTAGDKDIVVKTVDEKVEDHAQGRDSLTIPSDPAPVKSLEGKTIPAGKSSDEVIYTLTINKKDPLYQSSHGNLLDDSSLVNTVTIEAALASDPSMVQTQSDQKVIRIGNPKDGPPFGFPLVGPIFSLDDLPHHADGTSHCGAVFMDNGGSQSCPPGGLDIAAVGDIISPMDGVITWTSTGKTFNYYGRSVKVEDYFAGVIYAYSESRVYKVAFEHITTNLPKEGTQIKRGEPIIGSDGKPVRVYQNYPLPAGALGYSSGPHLHYEVLRFGDVIQFHLPKQGQSINAGKCSDGAVEPATPTYPPSLKNYSESTGLFASPPPKTCE